MRKISLDLETRSSMDLTKIGVYKYAETPDFAVRLNGYSIDNGSVRSIDLASGETIPDTVIEGIMDPSVEKWAFNASFERICLSRYLRDAGVDVSESYDSAQDPEASLFLNPQGWHCSMVWASYLGLPRSLEAVAKVLCLEEQKMSEGKDLIRFFCLPQTARDGSVYWNLPEQYPEKWELFKKYNRRDVEVEQAIQERLKDFPVPDSVWEEYWIDQQINDRGVALDCKLVKHAITMNAVSKKHLLNQLHDMTGLENPNSPQQMKGWLESKRVTTTSLDKRAVGRLLVEGNTEVKQALRLYQDLSKSSLAKYQAMDNVVCEDGRVRGMFQFFGTHTGRWAGRLVQTHNLPRNTLFDLAGARELVLTDNMEAIELLYGSVSDTLSQLIRTSFGSKTGSRLIIADYSAIEARDLAWMAHETWRETVFADNRDIYCESAAKMFGVRVEKHGENSHLRAKGKIAELALGYGGSVGALKAMGALEMGLKEDELQALVDSWRQANPHIVRFWKDVGYAAIKAVKNHGSTTCHNLSFKYREGLLFIFLPSGRSLAYMNPRIETNENGWECLVYDGVSSTKKWERIETYGAKLVENIIQAISRDLLCHAMKNLQDYRIVMHIHDEIVVEAAPEVTVEEICKKMCTVPSWAEGLVLAAEGFEADYYQKD